MKKLLLFVIACTLGLFGTVNAQETSFNYDFNDGSLAGWRLIDHNGDGYNWGASNSTLFGGVDGTYGLYSSCYEGSSLLPKNYIMTENKYLITESSVFSFVHIQSDAFYYSENICVVVSDDINDTPADFDQIWCEEYSSPYTEWQEVSVSLAAYAGQEVYIGLYHYGSGSNATGIRVDNVKLEGASGEGGEEPEPTPDPEPEQPGGEELASEFAFDFEDGTLTGLRVFQGEGATGNNWQVTAYGDTYYSGYGNSNGIYSVSWDENAYTQYYPNNYVVTEQAYQITENSVLSWYMRYTYLQYGEFDKYEVVASEDGTNFDMVLWEGDGNGSNENTLSLAEYAGKALYLGFRHYAESDPGDALVLDNITLTAGEGGEGGEEPEPTPDPEPEMPEGDWTCTVSFTLKDSYGDGWNNNTLIVTYGTTSETLTLTAGYTETFNLEIPKGSHVTATYKKSGSYQTENGFVISYYGGEEIIDVPTGSFGNSSPMENPYEFDVNCMPSLPSVPTIVATATSGSTIVLTIDAAGASSYNIYKDGELFVEGLTEKTYVLENLDQETEYCFTATALNVLGESEQSEAACATTLKAGTAIVQIGTGTTNTYQAPINNYWSSNSVSQMIYTEEEIGYGSGKVTSISFKQNEGGNHTRNLSVYLKNVDKDYFGTTSTEWEQFTSDLCVYEGSYTFGTTGWVEIVLQNEFVYEEGSNLLVCVIDNTGSFPQNAFEGFAADVMTDVKAIFGTTSTATNPLNITTYSYPLQTGNDYLRPIAKFIFEPADADVKVNPETIAFGEAQLVGYWSEEGTPVIPVTVKPIVTTITSITCDNDFFVLPTLDLTAKPIEFVVDYDKNAAPGEYTGNLTITYGDGVTKVVPMSATAYMPIASDVYELAQEITENVYTDTPVFANLKDDYNLPKEVNNGNTPDAVYSFELTQESNVTVSVTGTNAKAVIYNEDFNGEGGPSEKNNNKGNAPAPTTFFYDFEDGSLEDFTLIDVDNNGHNWFVTSEGVDFSKCIKSYSWCQSPSIYAANNIIVTNEVYNITENSQLSFDVAYNQNAGSNYPDRVRVELSKDGETFVLIETINPGTYEFVNKTVDLGAGLATLGLEPGEYYVALRHQDANMYDIRVDNIRLTDGVIASSVEPLINAVPYTAGKYYLVVAAEDEFTVNVAIEALEGEDPTPTEKAYRLESVGTSWGATVYTYDEENTNTVVAIDEDGLITEVTYNEAGQIASAIASYEDVDEEGNPIEVIVSGVEYTYNEDGLWVSYAETVQSWFGGSVTTETELGYDAEGRIVSLTSPELVRAIAYNEAGLISEVVEGYIVVEEEGEEEGEEGDDNGIAPLSETEIEYSSKITFEYDAEGRLVEKNYYFYDAYETMEFYWGESEVYAYDENGNCVKKEAYEVTEENELKSFPYSVTEYIYDLTINDENVYKFEYPHFAFINYVEPSYANILVKEMSFYSYYDEDVEEVVSHSYEVTAYNYNPAVVLLPLTPMNLTAEVMSATEVELAWAGFADAESFIIYQGEDVIATEVEDPYYTVEDLEMGVEYCFTVVAVNTVGTSEASEPVCVTIELPAAPANLVAEALSDTEIALTWDEVPGIWSYNVYSVTTVEDVETYELVGEAWWVEYTVEGLTAETEYSFVVKAVSNVGESAASNVATATTLAPAAPTVPAAPVVTGSFEGDIVILEWEAVEGALAYNLYYAGKLLAGPFEDLIVEIQVPSPGEYCFTVTAVNEVGESEHSEEVCVTVTAPEDMEAPAAPVLEATLDGNKAILSWEEVEGATYYDVYIGSTPEQAQYLGTATMEDLPISLELPEPGEYCFFVVAYNLAGASEPSNVACVKYGEGVEENEATFNIYPNPVSDNLVIETEANIEAVTIYTVTGVVVYNEVEFSNNTINVSDFANGVYIMKVRTENGEAVKRFVKK